MIAGIFKACQALKPCLQRVTLAANHPHQTGIHTTACASEKKYDFEKVPRKWLEKNKTVYPPQEAGEDRRPAWVCHQRTSIKYSPHKLWYIASMIRGKSIDEAVKQLGFLNKKGSLILKEVLLEAQDLAVREHNVEFKSNLFVAEAVVGKGQYIKGYRRHARGRLGIVHYNYCHFFVRLEEGPAPKFYYQPEMTGNEKLEEYMTRWRARRIVSSL